MSIVGAVMVPHPPLLIPEVGHGEERGIQSTIDAYREAMRFIAHLKPDTVIISSPHSILYSDYFHISPGQGAEGTFAPFGAPQVRISCVYDTEFVNALATGAKQSGLRAGTLGDRQPELDHATMIPLYFL